MKKLFALLPMAVFVLATHAQNVTGELKRWHKVTITFDGPNTSESANPNPFTDYRLDVTFTNGSSSYTVPGYYAGCGNAADSNCNSGNKWKVHFSPGKTGNWNWKASFKQGDDIAIKSGGSSAGFMDNDTGSFSIDESNKSGRDHRAKDKGLLQYVGEHYLRYSGTNPDNPNGNWFVKAGADSPENALNYVDFDATPSYNNNLNKIGSKSWAPHQQDYNASDASAYTWNGGKGTEILGMINYLSSQGANVFSFLTWNTSGDGGAVFPHTLRVSLNEYGNTSRGQQWSKVNKDRFDVSKLAQWERMMEYADKKGMYMHFKTMETENDNLMDGDNFGRQRKLYYRELIARFSHHLALNWNLTEETTLKDAVVRATAQYIKDIDPYDHNIVIHTYPNQQDQRYDPLLGNKSVLTGASIQTDKTKVHNDVRRWLEKSRNNGKKWVVANDEQGSANEGVRVSDKRIRDEVLWGTLMAGGAGVEYYSGYTNDDGDINGNDHRKRGGKYRDGGHALAFFNNYLQPYMVDMVSSDGVTSDGNDYVFAKAGEVYAVYRPNGGSTNINLQGANSSYKVQWYNPRAGGNLTAATNAGSSLQAPSNDDWVALITKNGTTNPNPDPNPGNCGTITLDATSDFSANVSGFSPAYIDTGRDAMAINAEVYKNKFAAGETTFNGDSGQYNIRLNTLTEVDGESQYRISVNGTRVGTYENPTTNTDYTTAGTTFNNIQINKGQKIRVEFNSVTNGKIPEGDGTAFSRGRWTSIQLSCTSTTPTPPPTTDNCNYDFEEKDGVAVIEVERLDISGTSWRKRTGTSGFSGDNYLEWTGSDNFNNPGNGVISAKVKINSPGTYRFQWRNKVGIGNDTTEHNDTWLKINADDFFGEKNGGKVYPNGAGKSPIAEGASANGWMKVYSNGTTAWSWRSSTNDFDPHAIFAQFNGAGVYTIQISGRSKNHLVDRIVLYKASVSEANATNLSRSETLCTATPTPTPPSGGPAGYTFATDEGGTVNVTGTVNIAYGANGSFIFRDNVSSDTPCNNATFGDPINGVKKACYIQQVSTPGPDPTPTPGAIAIPGSFEAEDYTAKLGTVKIEDTPGSNGQNIGFIRNGDYVEYDVTIASSGQYTFDIYAASKGIGGVIDVMQSGQKVADVTIPITGDWHNYRKFSPKINLTSGAKKLRFVFRGGTGYLFNIDKITTTSESAPVQPLVKTVTLSPIHDAYLQNSTRFNSDVIRIESGRRTGYLLFDLSQINGNVTKADLKFSIADDKGNGNLNIYKGSNTSWSENNLSNNNKPNTGSLVGSSNGTFALNNTKTISLNANQISGNRISFVLNMSNGDDFSFASKEHNAISGPQLVVTYSTTANKAREQAIPITLFPNPANDRIMIQGVQNVLQISIYDMLGRKVRSISNLEGVNSKEIIINDLPLGMYLVKAQDFEAFDNKSLLFSKQ